MNKSEVRSIIHEHGLHPNKALGQNFLISNAVRDRIIDTIGLIRADSVLEVGPGLGALTEPLTGAAGMVTAVEIDSGFCRFLAKHFSDRKNFRLVHADFLKASIEGSFTKIVSNLPYYCSSEILFKILQYDAPAAYLMLQKEMAERIVSGPGQKAYGALTVTLSLYYEPVILFSVPRQAFYPQPEVASSFLSLCRRGSLALKRDDIAIFHRLVKSAFWGRRKMIRTALSESPHLRAGREWAGRILDEAGINGRSRGEELGLDDYIALVRAYKKIRLNKKQDSWQDWIVKQ